MGKLSFISWFIFAAVCCLFAYFCIRFKKKKVYFQNQWRDVEIENTNEGFQPGQADYPSENSHHQAAFGNICPSEPEQPQYLDPPPPYAIAVKMPIPQK